MFSCMKLTSVFFHIWLYFPFFYMSNKQHNLWKETKMKNWKKWLVAGCMAALLGIGTMGTTAMAMGGGGVDRS